MFYFRNGAKAESGWKGPGKVLGAENNIVIIRHGERIIHANKRDVRKFLKDDNGENSWGKTRQTEEKQMMKNKSENSNNSNLINRSSNVIVEPAEIDRKNVENNHVKNSNMPDINKQLCSDKQAKRQTKIDAMARRPIEQMAFKSGGFPSPQLIVIKTDSISLDKFLQIGHLAIEQGHYITSTIDTHGKVGEQVLRIIDQHRRQNSFHRAVRQIEQERTQMDARVSFPPTKSPRLQEQENQQEVG